jgi:MFS family permease
MSENRQPRNLNTYLFILAGQIISMLGSGLTNFALGVWIYDQTGRVTPLALTFLFASLPNILLQPIAGAFADRYSRKKLMMLADTGDALVTGAAALLLFFGSLQIWHIYLFAFFSSAFSAFQGPAFQASVTMLVPKKDLARASGLAQMADAVATILTPILAGVLYSIFSLRGIIIIDFITYFFAIGAVALVRIPQPERQTPQDDQKESSLWQDIQFGWVYLRARPGLFWLLTYFALINFFLSTTNALAAPLVLAYGTATELGTVQMVAGIALLVGSIIMSSWGGPKQRKVWGVIGFIALSAVGLIISGLRPNTWVVAGGRFIFLALIPFAAALSNAVFATKVAPDVQGRVFSIRRMIASSMTPLALLLAGPLADFVFEPLMAVDGLLGAGWLGNLIGAGTGRGSALMFIASGLLMWAASAAIFANPRVRNVELELPDAIADDPPTEEDLLIEEAAPQAA